MSKDIGKNEAFICIPRTIGRTRAAIMMLSAQANAQGLISDEESARIGNDTYQRPNGEGLRGSYFDMEQYIFNLALLATRGLAFEYRTSGGRLFKSEGKKMAMTANGKDIKMPEPKIPAEENIKQ